MNLGQIHSSTVPGKLGHLCIEQNGPMHIKVGGTGKGTSSGLVTAHNYLDLHKL